MKTRILGAADIHRFLPMERCIETTRQAMVLTSSGQANQPIRTKLDARNGRGLLSMMPGWIADPDCIGIKVVTVFPANFGTGISSHQGMVLLCDPTNGSPLAILDGGAITAIRTGAASAVATDALANPEAATLGIYGYGEQAGVHIEALRLVRRFQTVLVWGRDPAKAREFARKQAARWDMNIDTREDPAALAAECDVLCTTTAAPTPFFHGAWLRPGQHINVVGSSIPTTTEVDIDTILQSRVFVDFRDSAIALGGDIRRATEAALGKRSLLMGEVGAVISGKLAGRSGPNDITLFKSLGMISEDLTAAYEVFRAAELENGGAVIEF